MYPLSKTNAGGGSEVDGGGKALVGDATAGGADEDAFDETADPVRKRGSAAAAKGKKGGRLGKLLGGLRPKSKMFGGDQVIEKITARLRVDACKHTPERTISLTHTHTHTHTLTGPCTSPSLTGRLGITACTCKRS